MKAKDDDQTQMVGSELDDCPRAPTPPDDEEVSENLGGKEQEEEGDTQGATLATSQVGPQTRLVHNFFMDAKYRDLVKWWQENRFLYGIC